MSMVSVLKCHIRNSAMWRSILKHELKKQYAVLHVLHPIKDAVFVSSTAG